MHPTSAERRKEKARDALGETARWGGKKRPTSSRRPELTFSESFGQIEGALASRGCEIADLNEFFYYAALTVAHSRAIAARTFTPRRLSIPVYFELCLSTHSFRVLLHNRGLGYYFGPNEIRQ